VCLAGIKPPFSNAELVILISIFLPLLLFCHSFDKLRMVSNVEPQDTKTLKLIHIFQPLTAVRQVSFFLVLLCLRGHLFLRKVKPPTYYSSKEGDILLLKSPHIYGHTHGGHPFDVPVEKQEIAAVFMASPSDPPAPIFVLTVRGRQMSRIPDIASVGALVVGIRDYWPPRTILIIGKVDSICSTSAGA
jgi:hypothetical protein